jgi:excisionase family DNA binding protein
MSGTLSEVPADRPKPEKLVLTVKEVQELTGFSRTLIYEQIRAGAIPSVRVGRRVVVPRKALDAMLETGGR